MGAIYQNLSRGLRRVVRRVSAARLVTTVARRRWLEGSKGLGGGRPRSAGTEGEEQGSGASRLYNHGAGSRKVLLHPVPRPTTTSCWRSRTLPVCESRAAAVTTRHAHASRAQANWNGRRAREVAAISMLHDCALILVARGSASRPTFVPRRGERSHARAVSAALGAFVLARVTPGDRGAREPDADAAHCRRRSERIRPTL